MAFFYFRLGSTIFWMIFFLLFFSKNSNYTGSLCLCCAQRSQIQNLDTKNNRVNTTKKKIHKLYKERANILRQIEFYTINHSLNNQLCRIWSHGMFDEWVTSTTAVQSQRTMIKSFLFVFHLRHRSALHSTKTYTYTISKCFTCTHVQRQNAMWSMHNMLLSACNSK